MSDGFTTLLGVMRHSRRRDVQPSHPRRE